MFKSGWTVVGLGVLFVIIQSCGDEMGTGRIMTPGATGQTGEMGEPQSGGPSGQQQPVVPGPMSPSEQPDAGSGAMEPVAAEDGGWPAYEYDDGREYWDGGAPIVLDNWHWNQGVSQFRGQYGQRYTMNCIKNGSEFAVWGSNPYTDDSPVCTAAAHLGLMTRAEGGSVTVEIRPAQKRFVGGDANGVTAFPWGPYPGSYRIIR
mgnify:CR=1 FL=1